MREQLRLSEHTSEADFSLGSSLSLRRRSCVRLRRLTQRDHCSLRGFDLPSGWPLTQFNLTWPRRCIVRFIQALKATTVDLGSCFPTLAELRWGTQFAIDSSRKATAGPLRLRSGQAFDFLRCAPVAHDDKGLFGHVLSQPPPPHEREPLTPVTKTFRRGHRVFAGDPGVEARMGTHSLADRTS